MLSEGELSGGQQAQTGPSGHKKAFIRGHVHNMIHGIFGDRRLPYAQHRPNCTVPLAVAETLAKDGRRTGGGTGSNRQDRTRAARIQGHSLRTTGDRDANEPHSQAATFRRLSTPRTHSRLMERAKPSATSWSASKRNVQRAWPSGAGP